MTEEAGRTPVAAAVFVRAPVDRYLPTVVSVLNAAPGMVEIWDTTKPEEKREIEPWQAPFDDVTETSPQVRLAQKIARNVLRWRAEGYPVEGGKV